MPAFPFTIASPWLFAGACAICVAAAALTIARRPAIHAATSALAALALLMLALAAGGLTWHRPASTDVIVMVDLSASTRGADYRNRANLDLRIKQLLGSTPFHTLYFSDHNTPHAPDGAALPDLSGDKTVFTPPAAVAIVLFSDGRFDPPAAAPPIFPVPDPALDQPDDAAVARLETRQNQLAVTIAHAGAPRRLTLDAATTQPTAAIDSGALVLTRPIKPGATIVTAQLNKGDLWPENDSLSLALAPPMRTQRWYVSTGAVPPGDWKLLRPNDPLLADPTQYLSPSLIVLDNLPASALLGPQQIALEQYVRDLGGALIIAGGDQAFSQGFYPGTAIEALSPLASTPPTPAVQWMLLADSSGSMSQAIGNTSRWRLAASAISSLLPHLPPEDPVNVGSFAAELTWWSSGKSARETALALPPPAVAPSGPTNLAAALDRIARESAGGLATELLVVSDADTTIDNPNDLVQRLKAKKIRLHLLAIGDGGGLKTLQDMTAATGGTLRRQLNPAQWSTEVRQLLAAAWPKRLIETPTTANFVGDLSATPPRVASPWNRTWLKKSASPLAQTTDANETIPLCARWTLGNGEAVACAFALSTAELEAIAKLIAKPPRDPRFTVTWDAGPRLHVRIDAAQSGKYLNGLPLRLELSDEENPARLQTHDIPQTAPGRYELSLPAPRTRSFAAIRRATALIDRIPVAARYAPEFDAVGNDYEALRTLAQRTGGKLIDRAWNKPIEFPFPRRELALAPWLGLFGAIFLALGLARWRFG